MKKWVLIFTISLSSLVFISLLIIIIIIIIRRQSSKQSTKKTNRILTAKIEKPIRTTSDKNIDKVSDIHEEVAHRLSSVSYCRTINNEHIFFEIDENFYQKKQKLYTMNRFSKKNNNDKKAKRNSKYTNRTLSTKTNSQKKLNRSCSISDKEAKSQLSNEIFQMKKEIEKSDLEDEKIMKRLKNIT